MKNGSSELTFILKTNQQTTTTKLYQVIDTHVAGLLQGYNVINFCPPQMARLSDFINLATKQPCILYK